MSLYWWKRPEGAPLPRHEKTNGNYRASPTWHAETFGAAALSPTLEALTVGPKVAPKKKAPSRLYKLDIIIYNFHVREQNSRESKSLIQHYPAIKW